MKTKKLNILSNFLKEKRLAAGLSQSAVAKKLGYKSPQFVSNWERGLSDPPIQTLRKISVLYNVSLEEVYRVTLESTIRKMTSEMKRKFTAGKK